MPDNHASAKVTFVQFRKAPCLPNDRSRKYTTTFVSKVSNLIGEIFTFKFIIPQENNNLYIRNIFPTGNIENPIGISKNPTEIIFSKVRKYILQVFNSDRQFSYIKFRFPIGLNEILFRSNPIGIFIPIGKNLYSSRKFKLFYRKLLFIWENNFPVEIYFSTVNIHADM